MLHQCLRIAALILIVCAVVWIAAPSASADAGVGTWHMTGLQLEGHPDERVATLANGRVLVVYADGSVTDLAHQHGLAMSTTHRYISTLVEVGVLERDPVSRHYRLTQKG